MQKPNLSKLKSKVWDEFSIFIRLRDATAWLKEHPEYNGDPIAPCITCRRMYTAFGRGCLQAGHFIPGRGNAILFDEEQVNAQCDSCNRHKKGNWPPYYETMVARHGLPKVERMLALRHETRKYTIPELEDLLLHYKAKNQELRANWG